MKKIPGKHILFHNNTFLDVNDFSWRKDQNISGYFLLFFINIKLEA